MEDPKLKRAREDLQNRIDILRKQADVSAKDFIELLKTKFILLLSIPLFLVLEL